jgi:hypothetical protein
MRYKGPSKKGKAQVRMDSLLNWYKWSSNYSRKYKKERILSISLHEEIQKLGKELQKIIG